MIKKRCKKIHHENYDERYEEFENRVFRLSAWVVALIGIFATVAIGVSIAQIFISQKTIDKLNDADKNNTLLASIALAATPNAKIQAISEAIDADPNNAKLYYYRAIANYTNFPPENIPEEIIDLIYEDCTSATEKKSNYADAYFLKGQILFDNRRNYTEAYENFLKAYGHKIELTVDVSKGQLYRYLGLSCFCNNDYENTVKYLINIADENKKILDEPIEHFTSSTEYALGKSYEFLKDFNKALNSYDKLISDTYAIEQKIELCNIAILVCEKANYASKKNEYLDMINKFEKGNYQ